MTANQQTLVEPLLLSTNETAKMLSVSIRLVQALNASGRIPLPVKLGRRTLWVADELRAWIAAGTPPREKWQIIKETKHE